MNKMLYLLMISLVSFNSLAQDTLHIPQQEINDIISVMDTLVEQDSINNILINDMTLQIANYEQLSKQDSIILSFKDQEIYLYNKQIKLYQERIKVTDRWYNRRPFGFILGVATTVILIHTVGYTLP